MAANINKQPVFTAIPLLITNQFDSEVPTTLRNPGMDLYTIIYTDGSDYGSLITKITVNATGLVGNKVTTKVIYLGIKDTTSSVVSLYQSKVMTGVNSLTSTDVVPYVIFEFGGGLIMNKSNGVQLAIAASTNRAATGETGDQISVVVEGGTYDLPA